MERVVSRTPSAGLEVLAPRRTLSRPPSGRAPAGVQARRAAVPVAPAVAMTEGLEGPLSGATGAGLPATPLGTAPISASATSRPAASAKDEIPAGALATGAAPPPLPLPLETPAASAAVADSSTAPDAAQWSQSSTALNPATGVTLASRAVDGLDSPASGAPVVSGAAGTDPVAGSVEPLAAGERLLRSSLSTDWTRLRFREGAVGIPDSLPTGVFCDLSFKERRTLSRLGTGLSGSLGAAGAEFLRSLAENPPSAAAEASALSADLVGAPAGVSAAVLHPSVGDETLPAGGSDAEDCSGTEPSGKVDKGDAAGEAVLGIPEAVPGGSRDAPDNARRKDLAGEVEGGGFREPGRGGARGELPSRLTGPEGLGADRASSTDVTAAAELLKTLQSQVLFGALSV